MHLFISELFSSGPGFLIEYLLPLLFSSCSTFFHAADVGVQFVVASGVCHFSFDRLGAPAPVLPPLLVCHLSLFYLLAILFCSQYYRDGPVARVSVGRVTFPQHLDPKSPRNVPPLLDPNSQETDHFSPPSHFAPLACLFKKKQVRCRSSSDSGARSESCPM